MKYSVTFYYEDCITDQIICTHIDISSKVAKFDDVFICNKTYTAGQKGTYLHIIETLDRIEIQLGTITVYYPNDRRLVIKALK